MSRLKNDDDNEFYGKNNKRAEQQKSGFFGSRIIRQFLIGKKGRQIPVSEIISGIQNVEGVPHAVQEQRSITLHCGHTAHSKEEIVQCKYDHLICEKCSHEVFSCHLCGEKLCSRDGAIVLGESRYCRDHHNTIGLLKLIGFFSITFKSFLGINDE